jgi:alpha-tubulin suppressor-like RCC1 family protein
LPPIPEQAPIYHESFDEDFFLGETSSVLSVSGLGMFDESWSGYALQRTGASVTPFIVPALNSSGHTNISSDAGGALRFWMRPYWTSGTAGPGVPATLLEFDAVSGVETAYAWSLQVSADGSTMSLYTQTDAGVQEVLQASIAWEAGVSHNVILDFNTTGTALFLDGTLAAEGSGLTSIPPSAGELVLGSTLGGTNAVGADVEEFCSFNRILTDWDAATYFQFTSGQAALGPMSYEEERSHHHHSLESAMTSSFVFDPDLDTGCPTGGPPYITNFSATVMTNGTTTINFDVAGGTNGVFYDVYSLTNLAVALDTSQWSWVGQVLTCNNYTFTNQPANCAFYFIMSPVDPSVIAWGNNSSGQCNVPVGLTNAVAVAVAGGFNFSVALRGNGTVIAWGDNTYGQTNVPAGLTNVIAIAAGDTHGLALLANGAVTNWGSYWTGGTNATTDYLSVTNYSPPASNVTAIAAGMYHDLALQSNGTVLAWGLTDTVVDTVPTNLTGVQAIACGWYHNVALLTNGSVVAWGLIDTNLTWTMTNVPSDLTNVVAIAAGALHSVALRPDGSVEAWGMNWNGETNAPGLSNVVAVSAGSDQSMALGADGTLVAWGTSGFPEATVPTNIYGVKAIASGFGHNLVIASSTLPPLRTEPPDGFAPAGGSFTFFLTGLFVANVQYQWQFNGTNLTGQTNATLTLTSVSSGDNGNYQVVISNASGTLTSLEASFAIALPPQITNTTPQVPATTWINYPMTLSVEATAPGSVDYPLSYQWQLNTTNISGATGSNYTISTLAPTNDGNYTVVITNALGSTNATWTEALALPGMVEAWGSDTNGECDRPATLTNATAIAAGDYHSVAVTDNGTVLQWGKYSDGTNFYAVGSPPSYSNVVAVAASLGHDLALRADGSVANWGLTNDFANFVPTNLQPAKAIAAGWYHNIALLTNGAVTGWGSNTNGQTTIPSDLTNANAATAIAAGQFHSLALRVNGTVEAWGGNAGSQTSVPTNLTGVVAIAAGGQNSVALKSDGTVVVWGTNDFGQTNVPSGMSNFMAIAAGSAHCVALQNDGTLVAWGDNTNGQATVPAEQPFSVITGNTNTSPPSLQTNTYPPIVVKLIAAGGNHSMAAIFSPLVQYPVDVSKDLLLIYNANSPGNGSSNVCAYYLAHRPMVGNANTLAIGCATNEIIEPADYTNDILAPVQTWLTNNPTKRPAFVILFQDIPSRVDLTSPTPSVQYELHNAMPTWSPFITSINMNGAGGTNDCIAYINKLAFFGSNYSPGQVILSASAGGYGNTNWYLDNSDSEGAYPGFPLALDAMEGVESNGISPTEIFYEPKTNVAPITNCLNPAAYFSWACNGPFGTNWNYPTNELTFSGTATGWCLFYTTESYNGERDQTFQGNFLRWFSSNAFGGTNYSNTPVDAPSHVDEPTAASENTTLLYGLWAAGKPFGITAWNAWQTSKCQAVGDPLTKR